jgi:hypothetical protein
VRVHQDSSEPCEHPFGALGGSSGKEPDVLEEEVDVRLLIFGIRRRERLVAHFGKRVVYRRSMLLRFGVSVLVCNGERSLRLRVQAYMVAALDDRVELRLSRLRREMAQFEARFIALVFTRCIRAEHLVFWGPKKQKKEDSGLRSNVN